MNNIIKRARPYIIRNGILQPFVYVLTPGLLLTYYQIDNMQDFLRNNWKAAYNFLDNKCLWVIIATFVLTWLGIAFKEVGERIRLEETTDAALRNRTPTAIMTAIGNVVGTKDKRFGELVEKVVKNTEQLDGHEVFSTITQPSVQLGKLIEAVHYIFSDIARIDDPDIKFKVSLISIEGGNRLNSIEHYHPSDKSPSVTIEDLRDPHSCASRALINKLVIVYDFQKELKKKGKLRNTQCYITCPDRMNEEGSMFSYRIDSYWNYKRIYIISVCASKKGYFVEDNRKLYEIIMEEIQKRISVEHSLLFLRSHVERSTINDTKG